MNLRDIFDTETCNECREMTFERFESGVSNVRFQKQNLFEELFEEVLKSHINSEELRNYYRNKIKMLYNQHPPL